MNELTTRARPSAGPTAKTTRRPSREEAEAAMRTMLLWAGDDPDREDLVDTPARVVRAYIYSIGNYVLSSEDRSLIVSQCAR